MKLARFQYLVFTSLGNLVRAPVRATLTMCGIAIATGALLTMIAFALGLQDQAERPFKAFGLLNQIHVIPRRTTDNQVERVLDEAALTELRQVPGVELVYPDLKLSAVQVARADQRCTAQALGLPREVGVLGTMTNMIVAGNFFSRTNTAEAVVSTKVVEALGWASPAAAIGESLQLKVAGLTAGAEQQQLNWQEDLLTVRVCGVFQPPSFAEDFSGNMLLLPVDLMANLPGSRLNAMLDQLRRGAGSPPAGFAQVVVRAHRAAEVPEVQQRIEKLGFRTGALANEVAEIRQFFLFLQFLLGAVGTVALVVGALGILNTMLMALLERKREIGIYRAIGASSWDIGVMFLTEACAMGIVGGLGGLALAMLVSYLIDVSADWYAAHHQSPLPPVEFYYSPQLMAWALGYAVVVTTLSGLYPALRAARMNALDALRD